MFKVQWVETEMFLQLLKTALADDLFQLEDVQSKEEGTKEQTLGDTMSEWRSLQSGMYKVKQIRKQSVQDAEGTDTEQDEDREEQQRG